MMITEVVPSCLTECALNRGKPDLGLDHRIAHCSSTSYTLFIHSQEIYLNAILLLRRKKICVRMSTSVTNIFLLEAKKS